jgi:hypothetical protein
MARSRFAFRKSIIPIWCRRQHTWLSPMKPGFDSRYRNCFFYFFLPFFTLAYFFCLQDSKPSKQFDLKNASIKYGEPHDNTLSIQISLVRVFFSSVHARINTSIAKGDGKMLLFSADSDSNVTVWCNLLNDVIQRNSAVSSAWCNLTTRVCTHLYFLIRQSNAESHRFPWSSLSYLPKK